MLISKYWKLIISVAWSIIIIFLSAIPGETIDLPIDHEYHIDKIGHFMIYLINCFLWIYTLRSWFSDWPKRRVLAVSFLYSTALGILMEIMQDEFFSSRNFDILDIVANIIGAFVGVLIFNFLSTKTKLWT